MKTRKPTLKDLHLRIAEVCPIDGVDSNGGIQFRDEANPGQRKAAQQVVDRWDWDAEVEREETDTDRLARLEQEVEQLKARQ